MLVVVVRFGTGYSALLECVHIFLHTCSYERYIIVLVLVVMVIFGANALS